MSNRRIVQIATLPMTVGDGASYPAALLALAEDGSLWRAIYSIDHGTITSWQALPLLPDAKAVTTE